MKTKGHLVTASAALAIGALFANVANANVITLYGDYAHNTGYYDADVARGSVECSVSCTGLLSSLTTDYYDTVVPDISTADGFSASSADLFYLGSDSEEVETAFVNAVVDPNLPTGVKTAGNGGLDFSFTSAAMYILLKIGSDPNMALLWNSTGQSQTYTYSGLQGSGAGLSHYLEVGLPPTSVPEPETLLLLLPGVAAMAMGMRRRKVAAAA